MPVIWSIHHLESAVLLATAIRERERESSYVTGGDEEPGHRGATAVDATVQGCADEEVGLVGGGGAVPQQPGEAVAWLLPDSRAGREGLRCCRVLPPRARRCAQLPRPTAPHTLGQDAEPGGDTGRSRTVRS
ncbi:AP2 [Musa troglodytarum]|uniref:AP2 n=1 Tax=Musa troglodytarum TaxID=320322 RepID=A0A9E7F5T0_9LILI|nr:AP2 [Musa troglodytarum]